MTRQVDNLSRGGRQETIAGSRETGERARQIDNRGREQETKRGSRDCAWLLAEEAHQGTLSGRDTKHHPPNESIRPRCPEQPLRLFVFFCSPHVSYLLKIIHGITSVCCPPYSGECDH